MHIFPFGKHDFLINVLIIAGDTENNLSDLAINNKSQNRIF